MEGLISRKEYPEQKELVIGVVSEVFQEFAYVELPEYENKKAMLHISEASEKWIKSVKDVVKEGDVIVCRVINVNPTKGYIDVSLRHISPQQKKRKFLEWRRKNKVHSIARAISEKHGLDIKEVYEKIIWPLEDKYGDVYSVFEEAVIKGPEKIKEVIKDKKLFDILMSEIKLRFVIRKVKLVANLKVFSLAPDGIERIKKVFKEALKKWKNEDIEVKYITAPNYRLEIMDIDYKLANKKLEEFCEELVNIGKKYEVIINYEIVNK